MKPKYITDQIEDASMTFQKAYPVRFLKPDGVFGTDWHIFDDHICVDSNILIDDDPDTFGLKYLTVGQLNILIVRG